jgi:hypothetical protein
MGMWSQALSLWFQFTELRRDIGPLSLSFFSLCRSLVCLPRSPGASNLVPGLMPHLPRCQFPCRLDLEHEHLGGISITNVSV